MFNKDIFRHHGYCPICEGSSIFSAKEEWFRDYLLCSGCGSIPRERALMKIITDFFHNYRSLDIHESSPSERGTSVKLQNECKGYTASQFYPDIAYGQANPQSGYRCENIERLTFPDNCFDLFITQDVMEHIVDPERAFKEIARVLRKGGAHIFTVPLVNKRKKSECRASRDNTGSIVYHQSPEYHENPIDGEGSLVTMDWGYDIALFILEKAKTPTVIAMIDNIDLGIRAEYIEVLISFKL